MEEKLKQIVLRGRTENLIFFHRLIYLIVSAEVNETIRGHNIILMSNHQTEADPAIIALLLEKSFLYIAENMNNVAGDRVVTDPLCKPLRMGRNLICVYSKKHLNDVPELVETKTKANRQSVKEIAMLLRSGSQIVWIAPSGGRDQPDLHTGEWMPAKEAYTQALYDSVTEQYNVLKTAIQGEQGLEASISGVSLSQP